MMWFSYKFRHMTQNWILIKLSLSFTYIYIYIYIWMLSQEPCYSNGRHLLVFPTKTFKTYLVSKSGVSTFHCLYSIFKSWIWILKKALIFTFGKLFWIHNLHIEYFIPSLVIVFYFFFFFKVTFLTYTQSHHSNKVTLCFTIFTNMPLYLYS